MLKRILGILIIIILLAAVVGLVYYDITNHSCTEDHSSHDCETSHYYDCDDSHSHSSSFDEIIHYSVHILVCVIFCTLFHTPIHNFFNWLKRMIGIKQKENCSH
jgi:CDP-diglyceride synthetase